MSSPTPVLNDTASPLRATRLAEGWSLRYVADRVPMDTGHLSKLERRQAGVSVDTLARLARVLGLGELASSLAPYVSRELAQ